MFYSKTVKAILKNSKSLKSVLKVLLVSVIFFSLFIYYFSNHKIGTIVEGNWTNKMNGKTSSVVDYVSTDLATALIDGGTIGSGTSTYSGQPVTSGSGLDAVKNAIAKEYDYARKFKKRADGTYKSRGKNLKNYMNRGNVKNTYLYGDSKGLISKTVDEYNSMKAAKEGEEAELAASQAAAAKATSETNLGNAISSANSAISGTDITALGDASSDLNAAISGDQSNVATYGSAAAASSPSATDASSKITDVSARITELDEVAAAAAAAAAQQEADSNGDTQSDINIAVSGFTPEILCEYEPFTEGMSSNVEGCAIPYSESLQFSKSELLFKIFDTDEIYQCAGNQPQLIQAKYAGEIPPGITIINKDGKGANEHMNYKDTIKMCNKKYKMKKSGDHASTEKINYGDRIDFTPNGWSGGSFSATVNPNIYGLDNVKDMTSDDFSAYFSQYTYCANSTTAPKIVAVASE